jgi:hypothetical protein
MGDTTFPRINEVANFLAQHSPETQRRLRETLALAELVKPGTVGGEPEAGLTPRREGLIARATVLSDALRDAIARSDRELTIVRQRLGRVKTLRYVGIVIGALGSSSVIGAAFVGTVATIIAGVIALASNVAALTADQLILGPKGSEELLREVAETLARVIGEGRLIERLITALLKTDFEDGELSNVLRDANALFGNLNGALARLAPNPA